MVAGNAGIHTLLQTFVPLQQRETQVATVALRCSVLIHSHPRPQCHPHSAWSAGRVPSSSRAQMWSTREPPTRLGYDSSSPPNPWMGRALLVKQDLDQPCWLLASHTQQIVPPAYMLIHPPRPASQWLWKRQLHGQKSQVRAQTGQCACFFVFSNHWK